MQTTIRQALKSDKNAILTFVENAYSEFGDVLRQKVLGRWSWQYLDNPCIDKEKGSLTILLAHKGDQIVGQACMTPVSLKVDDQYHTASWGTDFIVLPVCRGEGVGKKLMKIEVDLAKFMIGLDMPVITRKIAEKVGYKYLDTVTVYRRFMRLNRSLVYRYLMKRTSRNPVKKKTAKILCNIFLFDRVFSTVANILLGLRNIFEKEQKKEGMTDIQEVKNFDERIDKLWSSTNRQFGVIVKRDQTFLNWRYSTGTMLHYNKFIAVRDGDVKGYIVLRKEGPGERNFGIIADLYASRDDQKTVEDLLRHAIHFFGKDVAAIECATSVKEYQQTISRFGFLKLESTVPMYYCENSSVAAKLDSLKTNSFFSKGDHDWDQYTLF